MERKDQEHDGRPRYKGICEACQGDLYICKIIAQGAGPVVLGQEARPNCGVSLQLILNQAFERETWENFIEKMKGGFGRNGNGFERV